MRSLTDITEFLLSRIAEDEEAARLSPMRTWEARIPGTFEPIQILHKRKDVVAADVEENAARHIARWTPARVLAECEAKRRIIEFHQQWPVLIDERPKFTLRTDPLDDLTYLVTQQLAWLTTREYVARFGHEPPTSRPRAAHDPRAACSRPGLPGSPRLRPRLGLTPHHP